MNKKSGDLSREERIAYAKTLTEFDGQRSWYNARSSSFKKRAQSLDLVVILAGALIAALPILNPAGTPHWTEVTVSVLGALVVVCQGSLRIFRYGEIWPEYRQASERMKREWRLFVNSSGSYAVDEEVARQRYVERLETIIAEEQKIFFEQQGAQLEGRSLKPGSTPDQQS